MISSDVEPNYEVSRWKKFVPLLLKSGPLISNPIIHRVGTDSYEISVDALMQIKIRGTNTDHTTETWINFMLHNWISVTMIFWIFLFFNFQTIQLCIYSANGCWLQIVSTNSYYKKFHFFTSNGRWGTVYLDTRYHLRLNEKCGLDILESIRVDKKSNWGLEMSLIQFLLWNSGMHRRQWRYIHVSKFQSLKNCLWIQFILFCYVLIFWSVTRFVKELHTTRKVSHREITTWYETIFNLEKNLKMIIWRNAKNLGWRCRFNFFIERNIKFFMATKIFQEEHPEISGVLNRAYYMKHIIWPTYPP